MKRILISLSIIGVVAAIAIGATVAYFNDVETSTGNIFTAGTLDLKVDHVLQTYNDIYCKTCSVEIKSDTSNVVTGTNGGDDPVPFPHAAVQVSSPHPAWTVTGDIPGATWIWATDPTTAHDSGNVDVYYTFQKTFEWWGPVTGATLSLGVGTDNGYRVELNGDLVGEDWGEYNYRSPADTYSNFGSSIVQGTNVLSIKVKNQAMVGGTPATNPAGLLYKLTINGNCDNDYFKTHCTLWGEKDLAPGDHFFMFEDVKPGDRGTNVISLHSLSNNAWACLIVDNKTDAENDITNSESKLSDTGPTGELSQFIKVFGWTDNNKNGVYEPGAGETQLFSGSLADSVVRLAIADSTHGSKLIASNTYYVGLAWCAGTQSVVGNTISCDGSGMGDIAQSDSLTADVTAYIEQWRNNENFNCANVILP